jgi:hypothetical protein
MGSVKMTLNEMVRFEDSLELAPYEFAQPNGMYTLSGQAVYGFGPVTGFRRNLPRNLPTSSVTVRSALAKFTNGYVKR